MARSRYHSCYYSYRGFTNAHVRYFDNRKCKRCWGSCARAYGCDRELTVKSRQQILKHVPTGNYGMHSKPKLCLPSLENCSLVYIQRLGPNMENSCYSLLHRRVTNRCRLCLQVFTEDSSDTCSTYCTVWTHILYVLYVVKSVQIIFICTGTWLCL